MTGLIVGLTTAGACAFWIAGAYYPDGKDRRVLRSISYAWAWSAAVQMALIVAGAS